MKKEYKAHGNRVVRPDGYQLCFVVPTYGEDKLMVELAEKIAQWMNERNKEEKEC